MAEVKVVLSPVMASADAEHAEMGVEITVKNMQIRKGETLFSTYDSMLPRSFCCKKFNDFIEPMQLSDEEGTLETVKETDDQYYTINGIYKAARDTKGAIRIAYKVNCAAVGLNPVFDLGYEYGGLHGSGYTFMPAFPEGKYTYDLFWDLSGMPYGSIGAWAYGEGNVHVENKEGEALMDTFYACGLLNRVKFNNFGYYWFEGKEMLTVAAETSQIFDYESKFFKDEGEPYNIFIRKTLLPEHRVGGTAAERSYGAVYAEGNFLGREWLDLLFAHEMVHNWVHLDDTPFGTCTWYVEGMAEFYGALLPWRAGVADEKMVCRELNMRAHAWYENPARHISNADLNGKMMQGGETGRIQYGRGYFYMTHADEMIRRATNNEKCLDDLVLALNEKFKADKHIKNEAWIEEYGKLVGTDVAKKEFDEMAGGAEITPSAAAYEGKIKLVAEKGTERGTEKETTLWQFVPTEE